MSNDRKPYLPSNGTEFEGFYATHCRHCGQDDPPNEVFCPIILGAMNGQGGPDEWVRDPQLGPICTAYTEDNKKPARCPDTEELF